LDTRTLAIKLQIIAAVRASKHLKSQKNKTMKKILSLALFTALFLSACTEKDK
jgi:hypothetical protein